MTLYKKIVSMAEAVEYQVNRNQKLPVQKGYNWRQYCYLFAKSIITPNKDITSKPVKKAPNQKGTNINENIKKDDYIKLAKNLVEFVDKYGYLPNYLKFGGYKIRPILYTYEFARIVNYINKSKKYPKYCNFNSDAFRPKQEEKKVSDDEIFNYFIELFGEVNSIDEALERIEGLGYGGYYDDYLSNKETLHNLKYGGQKPNCTDISQALVHIGKALGYDVRTIHVMCRSGVGHVRQQFRHPINTGGNWINRDGACVIDGNEVTSIWCENGTYLATDPDWFMENVNR